MKYCLSILVCLYFAPIAEAATYCENVKSRGEGHWPIPEKAFTKKRAIEALGRVSKLAQEKDGYYEVVENELIYVKGYFLIKSLQSGDKMAKKIFCEFVKTEAYVRH